MIPVLCDVDHIVDEENPASVGMTKELGIEGNRWGNLPDPMPKRWFSVGSPPVFQGFAGEPYASWYAFHDPSLVMPPQVRLVEEALLRWLSENKRADNQGGTSSKERVFSLHHI